MLLITLELVFGIHECGKKEYLPQKNTIRRLCKLLFAINFMQQNILRRCKKGFQDSIHLPKALNTFYFPLTG